jgi:primosomal protein N'
MSLRRYSPIRSEARTTAVLLCLALCACGQAGQSVQQRSQIIEQLQTAKQLDERNACDPQTDLTQVIDSRGQAAKADQSIAALRAGAEVSQPELRDALDVPPSSLSPDAKIELIRELEEAKQRDQVEAQTQDPGNNWLAWHSYREQGDRANSVISELKNGEDVPWSEIQQALLVPESE